MLGSFIFSADSFSTSTYNIHQTSQRYATAIQANGNGDKESEKSMQEKFDDLIDTPFFDPDALLESQSQEVQENPTSSLNPLVWFAGLVKNDYQTAEALFAAGFISMMVVLGQEMLRFAKYGDAYTPFENVSSGSLF